MGKRTWLKDEGLPFGSVDTGQSLILERGKDPPEPPKGHVWALRGYVATDGSRGRTHAFYMLYRTAKKTPS